MLSKWSILPHTEQMQSYMPLSANHKSDEKTASETRIFRNQEDREVQALFAKEERIGKEKKQLRREKQRLKNNAAMNTAHDNFNPTPVSLPNETPLAASYPASKVVPILTPVAMPIPDYVLPLTRIKPCGSFVDGWLILPFLSALDMLEVCLVLAE
jgi:hypothetical protein